MPLVCKGAESFSCFQWSWHAQDFYPVHLKLSSSLLHEGQLLSAASWNSTCTISSASDNKERWTFPDMFQEIVGRAQLVLGLLHVSLIKAVDSVKYTESLA